jgi:hypothetical protein
MNDDVRRRFIRSVAEMRRGRLSTREMADDLIGRLESCGLIVTETAPDLATMAATLTAAGYSVRAPTNGK